MTNQELAQAKIDAMAPGLEIVLDHFGVTVTDPLRATRCGISTRANYFWPWGSQQPSFTEHLADPITDKWSRYFVDYAIAARKNPDLLESRIQASPTAICPCGISRMDCDYHK